jgi:3'-phosphoadenosine 5'-phosphosulfate sulfotransferase (PAPS reductase)/FAD synthetase
MQQQTGESETVKETCAFWSGHANSSAMVLRMIERKETPDFVVHACTRAEFDFVYDFMEKFEKHCEVEIIKEDVVANKPHMAFTEFFNKPWCKGNHVGEIHGMPFKSKPCWYRRNIKDPVYRKWGKICSETYVGFHVGERHRMFNNIISKTKYPLIEWGWTDKDSITYLRKRGIPHAAYDTYGFDRLGCWFCPKQSDAALFIVYKNRPDMFQQMLDMEENSPHGFRTGKSLKDLVDIWESKPNYDLKRWCK